MATPKEEKVKALKNKISLLADKIAERERTKIHLEKIDVTLNRIEQEISKELNELTK